MLRPFSSNIGSPAVETCHPSVDGLLTKQTGPDVTVPLLFLSFDGVLHPFRDGTFSKLALLEELLQGFPKIGLIICSDWKESNDLDVLLGFFSEDLAKRVIGVTPHLPNALKQDEIEAFLATLPRPVPWLAIDDDAALFKPDDPRVITTRTETGLDDYSLKELKQKLQELPSA